MSGTTNTTDLFRTLSASLGIVLVASVLVLTVLMKARPADAAFPGANGLIVFTSSRITADNPTGDQEIYTIDLNDQTSPVDQLTNNTAADFNPNWCSDGQKIGFTSNRDSDA